MNRLINTDGKHNKFWSAEVDSDHTVTCKWGRLGTNGQQKQHSHESEWAAQNFVDNKMRAKKRKGYQEVDDASYDLHVFRGQLVGAGAKISEIFWVKRDKVKSSHQLYTSVEAEEMYSPDYEPTIYAKCEFTGKRGSYHLIITLDSVCYATDFGRYYSSPAIVELKELQEITTSSPKILQNLKSQADGMVKSLL